MTILISQKNIFAGKDGDDDAKKRRKRRKKKKKRRGEENLREFERFSSGSDGSENLENETDHDDHDLLGVYDDELLFKSDHEFSCESDVPDDQAVQIKHARTAKKKRGRKPKAEAEAEEATSEEDDFACKICNKV